jgi:hypothetical protein
MTGRPAGKAGKAGKAGPAGPDRSVPDYAVTWLMQWRAAGPQDER